MEWNGWKGKGAHALEPFKYKVSHLIESREGWAERAGRGVGVVGVEWNGWEGEGWWGAGAGEGVGGGSGGEEGRWKGWRWIGGGEGVGEEDGGEWLGSGRGGQVGGGRVRGGWSTVRGGAGMGKG